MCTAIYIPTKHSALIPAGNDTLISPGSTSFRCDSSAPPLDALVGMILWAGLVGPHVSTFTPRFRAARAFVTTRYHKERFLLQ